MTATVAAAAFWRNRIRVIGLPPSAIAAYLGFILFLSKSLGALLYGAFLVPLLKLTKERFQVRVACTLVVFSIGYPLLRTIDVVPTQTAQLGQFRER